jgi:hypothetical protein
MPSKDGDDEYEREQYKTIQSWKASPPPIVERALGFIFKPLGWVIQKLIPPSAIEGALRSVDWLARHNF